VTAPRTGSEDLPRTLGELRASGHAERSVKEEIRENLLAALAAGDTVWPGIFGFEDTVLPQLERALIAGHDFVLLGERGQGKTRLLRSLANLLDEWTPVIAGAGSNSTREAVALAQAAERLGADGILTITPSGCAAA
jgi:magnesium chelatase subunit I